MKATILSLLLLGAAASSSHSENIPSMAYQWSDPVVRVGHNSASNILFEGTTTHLASLKLEAYALAGGASTTSTTPRNLEQLILVKDGALSVTIEDQTQTIARGSVAMLMPGQKHQLESVGDSRATYYLMSYNAKAAMDLERGLNAGGSFTIDWNDLEYKPHTQGGRRDYFDHATAMCDDFEMHATSLNASTLSHPPHTHIVEEIILMIHGNTEMQVGEKHYKMTTGDLVFVDSGILHGIRNTDTDSQSTYFAFQWK